MVAEAWANLEKFFDEHLEEKKEDTRRARGDEHPSVRASEFDRARTNKKDEGDLSYADSAPETRSRARRVQCPKTTREARARLRSVTPVGHFFARQRHAVRRVDLEPLQPAQRTEDWVSTRTPRTRTPGFASTIRTSLNPGNCWNNIESMDAVVASANE